jgi:hypothetical protein
VLVFELIERIFTLGALLEFGLVANEYSVRISYQGRIGEIKFPVDENDPHGISLVVTSSIRRMLVAIDRGDWGTLR